MNVIKLGNRFTTVLITIAIFTFANSFALAQRNNGNNNNRRDEQKENERVQRAQRALSEAQKELREKQADLKSAVKKLDTAQDKLVPAKRALREAEDAAEAEIGASLGIPEVVALVNSRRKEYDALAKPVLDDLHAKPEWKAVQADADKAKTDKEALRENVELEDDERDLQLKKLAAIIQRPFDIEDKALAANTECAAAKKLVDEAAMKLAELRKKISPGKVDSHPKVVAAQKALENVQKSFAQEEKLLTNSRTAATKAQRSVVAAQNELNRAKQADANDNNKGKKK